MIRPVLLALLLALPTGGGALAKPPADPAACDGTAVINAQRLEACDRLAATHLAPAALAAVQSNRSQALFAMERWAEAEAAADASLKLRPDDVATLVDRGRARYEQDHFDAALADYDAALKRSPDDPAGRYERGLYWHYPGKDPAKALADYRVAADADPPVAEAFYQQAILLLDTDPEAALKAVDAGIARLPKVAFLHRERGEVLEALERDREALAAYDQSLKLDPDSAYVIRARSALRRRLGDLNGALRDAETAIRLDPDDGYSFVVRAYVMDDRKKVEEARAAYAEAVKRSPAQMGLWLSAIRFERKAGDLDAALAYAQAALKREPDNADVLFERALIWVDKKDGLKALADWDRVIKLQPSSAAYYNRGLRRDDMGGAEEALADFRKAAELDPKDPDPLNYAGVELEALERTDEAFAAYEAALRINPRHVEALINHGAILARRNASAAALADYQAALELDPARTTLHAPIGELLAALGQNDKALAAYDRAIRAKAEPARTWSDKGDLLDALGRDREALAAYGEAIKADPKSIDAYVARARVLGAQGKDAEAIRDLDAALALEPASAYALNGRGLVYWRAEDNDNALATYDKALAADPDYSPAVYNRALVYMAFGRYDRAIRDINRSLQLVPGDVDSIALKAECYRQMEDYLRALELFDDAIRAEPQRALAWWRRGLTKEALGDKAGADADKAQAKKLDPKVDA